MASIIGRQVDSFADQVMADHYEAMRVQDVSDRMRLSVLYSQLLSEVVERLHELGGTFSPSEDVENRRVLNRLLTSMPRVLGWARRKAAEGHPTGDGDLDQYEGAIRLVRDCLTRLDVIAAENTDDPSLPSVDEFARQLGIPPADGYEAAKANATKLFGRAIL